MPIDLAAASGAVPSGVLAAVLCAALLHAIWNAIAHAIPDQLIGFALLGATYTVCAAVIVLAAPTPARSSWPYLAASGALHIAYNVLLMRSYHLGEFSQVYPLARGTSPWLVAIGAAVFAGETVGWVQLLGILTVSLGLACLVFAGGVPSRTQRPAIVAAVVTGISIAAYTTVDGLGVRHSGTAAGYTGWLFLVQGPVLPFAALATRRRRLWAQVRPHLRSGVIGGVLSLAAYALVLWAQTRGALAPIAALRETSVIAGAIIGAVLFAERFGRWRVTATVLVATGAILINL